MPNTKRGFGSAGLIIVILIIIVGGAYFWSQKKTEIPASIVLSPKTGDVWVIGEPHTIKLTVDPHTIPMVSTMGLQNKNGKFAGMIDCLKYGEDQRKEFEWDTKTVIKFCGAGPSEERYSEIVPGDYRIVLGGSPSFEPGSNYFTISAPPNFRKVTYTLPGCGTNQTNTFTIADDPNGLYTQGAFRVPKCLVYFFNGFVGTSLGNRGVVVVYANYGASANNVYLVLVDTSTVQPKQMTYLNVGTHPIISKGERPYKIWVDKVEMKDHGLVSVTASLRFGNNFTGETKITMLNYQIINDQLVPLS